MEATNEFLARIPRSSDGKRRWPVELKARIVAETLIGCWTNIGEAKTYAKDQLELIGIEVVDDPKDAVSIPSLIVNSLRTNSGGCHGGIHLSIIAWVTWRDQSIFATLGGWQFSHSGQ